MRASDATAGIQAAINGCPAGQVVQLSAGTFTITRAALSLPACTLVFDTSGRG